MSDKVALETKMSQMLNEWDLKLPDFAARAGGVKTEKRAAFDGFVATMREKHAAARQKFAALERAPESNWKAAGDDLQKAWSEFVGAYSKAIIQFPGMVP